MNPALDLAFVAAAMADPSRANMLSALLGGVALPAGELAYRARVTAPTASTHLARLVDAGLVACRKSGRFRYYELAGPEVAEIVETMMAMSPRIEPARRSRVPPHLRGARLCYDHLAGSLGVGLTDRLVEAGHLAAEAGDFRLTLAGEAALAGLGLDIAAVRRQRRRFIRSCVDWSERRHHLAGALGAALADRLFELNWIRRTSAARAIEITPAGMAGLRDRFGLAVGDAPALDPKHTATRRLQGVGA